MVIACLPQVASTLRSLTSVQYVALRLPCVVLLVPLQPFHQILGLLADSPALQQFLGRVNLALHFRFLLFRFLVHHAVSIRPILRWVPLVQLAAQLP